MASPQAGTATNVGNDRGDPFQLSSASARRRAPLIETLPAFSFGEHNPNAPRGTGWEYYSRPQLAQGVSSTINSRNIGQSRQYGFHTNRRTPFQQHQMYDASRYLPRTSYAARSFTRSSCPPPVHHPPPAPPLQPPPLPPFLKPHRNPFPTPPHFHQPYIQTSTSHRHPPAQNIYMNVASLDAYASQRRRNVLRNPTELVSKEFSELIKPLISGNRNTLRSTDFAVVQQTPFMSVQDTSPRENQPTMVTNVVTIPNDTIVDSEDVQILPSFSAVLPSAPKKRKPGPKSKTMNRIDQQPQRSKKEQSPGICNFYRTNSLSTFSNLSKQKPKIRLFVFYGFGNPKERFKFEPLDCLEFIMILKDLFKSSCTTLVEFRTNLPVLNAVCQNCNSVLANLKVLDLHYEPDNFDILGHVSLDRMFPSLVTVYIRAHYDHDTKLIVPNLFYEWDYLELGPNLTVRNLIVQLNLVYFGGEFKKFQPAHLQLLAAAFPRVENFSIHQHVGAREDDFTFIIKSLMGAPWTELRRLEILSRYGIGALEPSLLGVSNEEYQLWKRLGRIFDLNELEFAATLPSIRDFPNLEFLKFVRHRAKEALARRPCVQSPEDGLTGYIYKFHHKTDNLVDNHKRGNDDLFDRFWSEDSEECDTVNEHTDTGFQVLVPCGISRIKNVKYFIKIY